MNETGVQPGKPAASIVIPTCDRQPVLARCLDALLHQTRKDFEVIVVDDCSSDGTPDELRQFASANPTFRLKILRNEEHAGANPSRNRGIATAEAEIVVFIDCDCLAQPNWLARLLVVFENPEVAAATGMVEDAHPQSIFDVTFKGTHRIHTTRDATRLVAGNMAVRRDLLVKHRLDEDRAEQLKTASGTPDVSVSGRGDEEGLFLALRGAGCQVRAVPDAVVIHEHHYNARSFFRQAYRGGRSAARLVYKFRLSQRIDLLPFILTYLSLPLALLDIRLLAVPTAFLLLGMAAITYNDLFRKRKSLIETIYTFPVLLLYYHCRLVGYVVETLRLRLTTHDLDRVEIRSEQA